VPQTTWWVSRVWVDLCQVLLDKDVRPVRFCISTGASAEGQALAAEQFVDGVRLIDTPASAAKWPVEADLLALEWSVLRILAQEKNKYDLNAVVSALKIRGSEMQQR